MFDPTRQETRSKPLRTGRPNEGFTGVSRSVQPGARRENGVRVRASDKVECILQAGEALANRIKNDAGRATDDRPIARD